MKPEKGCQLILDIETIPHPFAPSPALVQMAGKAEMDPESFAALHPALCQIICVVIRNESTQRSAAFVVNPHESAITCDPALLSQLYQHTTEAELLSKVAEVMTSFGEFTLVTFAGRSFDVPALVHRMVANLIEVPRHLARIAQQGRFKTGHHVDLFEEFTFGGAARGRGASMRSFALGYGIGDPKANGDGSDVLALWNGGRLAEIVAYCASDVTFTAALLHHWRQAGMEDRR